MSGLLEPIGIAPGSQVLEVACGPGMLTLEPLRLGAQVVALEADLERSLKARQRTLGHGTVEVVNAAFSEWFDDRDDASQPFDFVLYHAPDDSRAEPRDEALHEVLSAASELLSPGGSLVLLVRHRPGLAGMLSLGVPDDGSGYSRAGLGALLKGHGLRAQRWLIPYPTPEAPRAIVDTRTWDDPGGKDVAAAYVRDPLPDIAGQVLGWEPRASFQAASTAGLAADLADSLLLVAGRADNAPRLPGGRLWQLPSAHRSGTWRRAYEVRLDDGTWSRRALGPEQPVRSGPLSLEPRSVVVPDGESGEDVLLRALTDGGTIADASVAVLRDWWAAALAVIENAHAGHYPLDVAPRTFRVSSSAWHYVSPDESFRFRVPPEVLAFGAMVRTIRHGLLPHGWIPGIPVEADVTGGAAALVELIGFDYHDDLARLWVVIETDRRVRQGPRSTDRKAVAAKLTAQLQERMDARLDERPLHERLADARAAVGFAAMAAEHRSRITQMEAQGDDVASNEATLEAMQQALAEARAQRDEHQAQVRDLRQRIDGRIAQVESLQAVVGDTREELASSREELATAQNQAEGQRTELARTREELARSQEEQDKLSHAVADQTVLIVNLRSRPVGSPPPEPAHPDDPATDE